MIGFIFWIIVIIWIVSVVSKNKNRGTGTGTAQNRQSRPVQNQPAKASAKNKPQQYDQWEGFNRSGNKMKQQELKERLAKKYNRTVSTESEILKRAKASVEEDFADNKTDAYGRKTADNKTDVYGRRTADNGPGNISGNGKSGNAMQAGAEDAERRQKEIKRRIEEKLAAEEREHSDMMKVVDDLMVKGPDMELSFERDFLAEGIDMLNRIQA